MLLDTSAGRRIGRRWLADGSGHAPHLATVETTQVIRRMAMMESIERARGMRAIDRLSDLPFERHGHDLLLGRVWELRGNLSAYDATYIALAERLGAPLLTLDARLAASPGHRATIEFVAA